MHLRTLGPSGLSVSAIGLGGMPMSIQGRPSPEQSRETILAALDAGITFIDTADVYCLDDGDIGHNERLIAETLRLRPHLPVCLATKGGLERPGGAWTRNGHPLHLRAACERSLRALGVETIDLYQLHAPDPSIPFADSVGALADLQAQGKIRHIGLSNVSVDQIRQASALVTVVSVQNRAHPLDTSAWTSGVIAHCEAQGIAFLPYSPVGGGRQRDALAQHPALRPLVQRLARSPQEITLAWLLHTSPALIPIPGASKPHNARSSAAAADLHLSPEDQRLLDRAFLGAGR